VLVDANRNDLAEQLAALDIRDYVSIAALRSDLCRLTSDYCAAFPHLASQAALERFYFCESVEVTAPLGRSAQTLDEFRDGIAHLSHASFYFHFISSRLRLQLRTNDFRTGLRMAWDSEPWARASITSTSTPIHWTARAPSCCGSAPEGESMLTSGAEPQQLGARAVQCIGVDVDVIDALAQGSESQAIRKPVRKIVRPQLESQPRRNEVK